MEEGGLQIIRSEPAFSNRGLVAFAGTSSLLFTPRHNTPLVSLSMQGILSNGALTGRAFYQHVLQRLTEKPVVTN
jgi:hypothetical protein